MVSLWSVALRLVAPVAITAAAPPDSTTAFTDVTVIPMDHERILTDQTVLVQEGKITAIGPAATVKVPANARRIDGRGKFLIPGLADMHAHCSCSAGGGPRLAAAYLAAGVTTIRIMGGGPADVDLREKIKSGQLMGPTVYTAGPQVMSIASPEEAVRIVHENKVGGYDFIKVRNPEITPEILDSFVAAAHREKISFGGHMPGGPEISLRRWIRTHPVSIEHLDGYWSYLLKFPPGFKGVNASFDSLMALVSNDVLVPYDKDIDSIVADTKRAGVWNVPTQTVYNQFPGLTDAHQRLFVQLRNRIVKKLHDAGAGLLAGTDAVVSGLAPGRSLPGELKLMAEAGLTPYETLETATRNPAIFFGTLDQTGTVEVGKRADLTLLNGNPLVDIMNTATPAGVMVGGRWVPRAKLEADLAALGGP